MLLGAEQKSEVSVLREKLELLSAKCKSTQQEHKAEISRALKGVDLFHHSQISKSYEKSFQIQLLSLKLEQYSAYVTATLQINIFNIATILERFNDNMEGLSALLTNDSENQFLLKFARKKASHSMAFEEAKEKSKECKLQFEACQSEPNEHILLNKCANDLLTLNTNLLKLSGNIPDLYSDLFETMPSNKKFLCECYESIHLAENALAKGELYHVVLQELPVLNTTPRAQQASSSSSEVDFESTSSSDDNGEMQPNNLAILHQYQQGAAANQIQDINTAMTGLVIDENKKRTAPK